MTDLNEEATSSQKQLHNEMIQNLSEGVVSLYYPTLKSVKRHLLEIVNKQEMLYNVMHNENLKLSEAIWSFELQEMFLKIKSYKEKLNSIKKNMMTLTDQSTKLKKRALKLEQKKRKEALDKVQEREYEELLIRKPPKL